MVNMRAIPVVATTCAPAHSHGVFGVAEVCWLVSLIRSSLQAPRNQMGLFCVCARAVLLEFGTVTPSTIHQRSLSSRMCVGIQENERGWVILSSDKPQELEACTEPKSPASLTLRTSAINRQVKDIAVNTRTSAIDKSTSSDGTPPGKNPRWNRCKLFRSASLLCSPRGACFSVGNPPVGES